MHLSFHILRKDLYRYRWAVAFLLLLALIRILLKGTSLGWAAWIDVSLWNFISGNLAWFIGYVIVVLAVQEETLGDPDVWWITRPIARLYVFMAKTMFCLIVMMGMSGLSDAIILCLNHGSYRLPWFLLSLFSELPWIWLVMFLAVQTASLARFLLYLVGVFLGCTILASMLVYVIPLEWSMDSQWPSLLPSWLDEPWMGSAIRYGFLSLAVFVVLLRYYQTRRVKQAWMLIPVILFGLTMLFPQTATNPSDDSCQLSLSPATADPELHVPETILFAKASPFDPEEMIFYGHFYVSSIPANGDVWVFNVKTFFEGQKLRFDSPFSLDSQHAIVSTDSNGFSFFECELFRAKTSELREVESSPVSVSVYFYLLFGKPWAKPLILPLKSGATIAHNGHRIGIEKVKRQMREDTDQKLTITISEIIHNLPIEKQHDLSEVFSLRNEDVVFNLLNRSTRATYIVNPERFRSSRIELYAELPSSVSLNDLELWMFPGNIPEDYTKRLITQVNLRQLAGIDRAPDEQPDNQ